MRPSFERSGLPGGDSLPSSPVAMSKKHAVLVFLTAISIESTQASFTHEGSEVGAGGHHGMHICVLSAIAFFNRLLGIFQIDMHALFNA
jgi:hypothetical protein